jgi:antitoxin CptB
MNDEINRINWKCRRGMREIDLLLREFSLTSIKKLSSDDLSVFDEILNYDDQKLYDFIFKNESLGNKQHEDFINKNLKTFSKQGNF